MKSVSSSPLVFYGLCLFLILTWGSAFTIVGVGVRHISPLWLVAGRMCVAAVLLGIIARLSKHRFPPLKDVRWLYYFGLGLTGAVFPFFLIAQGQLEVDSGLSSIITGSMPLIIVVMAHFATEEKLNRTKMLGFVIGFLGVVILFFPDDIGVGVVSEWGSQLLILGAAFCYAFTTVAAKKAPKTPSVIGSAIMMIGAAIASVGAGLVLEPDGFTPNTPAWLSILALGVGATGIATIVYFYLIDWKGPSMMARLNYFVPPASVLFGIWLLDEPLTWKIPFAFVIIFIGVALSRRDLKVEPAASPSETSRPQTGLMDRSPVPHPHPLRDHD